MSPNSYYIGDIDVTCTISMSDYNSLELSDIVNASQLIITQTKHEWDNITICEGHNDKHDITSYEMDEDEYYAKELIRV